MNASALKLHRRGLCDRDWLAGASQPAGVKLIAAMLAAHVHGGEHVGGKTIICSPHKLYGPQANDLVLQLRKQRVEQIILAGMIANLCVESHLRDFLEQGFEVAVVRDAIAGPKIPEGDGYLSALINFRCMANGLWTTEETVDKLG